LATACELSSKGFAVAIGDIDEEALRAASTTLPLAKAGHLDVTDRVAFEALVSETASELGPVNVLVNNAGIMPIGAMLSESEKTARRVLEVNVLGTMNGMAAALPGMIDRGRGHVINVASIAGKAPVPGGVSYAASKAAIVSMTESARVEFAGSGVSFTCVMPSFTATDLVTGTSGTKFVKMVTPEDVARAIVSAIERRQPDVYVPSAVGVLVRLQPFLGRRIRDASQRAIGAYDTFLKVDTAARKDYNDRIAPK
jgi:NADP-dependent 3-hydroxy acid dehydrogenase YdfG